MRKVDAMSACLFTFMKKDFDSLSEAEIRGLIVTWKEFIDEMHAQGTLNGKFQADKYGGYSTSLERATYYLAGMERARKVEE